MKKQYTKAEKAEYFKKLRNQWKSAKLKADSDGFDVSVIWQESFRTGIEVSYYGFVFIYLQMKEQGLSGSPVIDAKTFHGWKQSGFKVKKGEKSTLSGITWVGVADSENPDTFEYMIPKAYHLFHSSQVEPIEGAS